MTPDELDTAIADVSHRMERVRALYEQYFMGIERLEPTIPRKELDRRLETLRKTSFQNTAKRFMFQTLIQRYTSLQQYWYRTCRDIENGTYKKHIKRAQKRFGNETQLDDAARRAEQERAEASLDAKRATEDELAQLLDSDADLSAEFEQAVDAGSARSDPKTTSSLLGTLGKRDTGSAPRAAAPTIRLGALGSRSSTSPTGPSLPPLARSTTTSPKPLPTLTTNAGAASRAHSSRAHSAAPQDEATPATKEPNTQPSRVDQSTADSITAPKRPSSPPLTPRRRISVGAKAPAQRPARQPEPIATSAHKTQPGISTPSARRGEQRDTTSLSAERIRALHEQYQKARADTNAALVSYEKLEKNIRETEAQLRAKHRGKAVDFDVSIKDGKAILRPRLK